MDAEREPSVGDDSYYGSHYYETGLGAPYERSEVWLYQFRRVAQRIVEEFQPQSVMDAGCAIGLLVECLVERDVDAHGIDISSFAIGRAHESIRDRCRVGSILEPFGRRFDLIVTIEVLEHLKPEDAERAVANLCAHADDILFSSTPDDFKEPSHFNVRPPDYWAELFARHGFYRDLDHDATYLTRWAARFRKVKIGVARLVSDYERVLWRVRQENHGVRESLVEYEGKLAYSESKRAGFATMEAATREFDRRMAERYAAEAALAAEFNQTVAAWSAHVQRQDALIQAFSDELQKARAEAEEAGARERTIRADKAEADSQIKAIQRSRAWRLANGLARVRKRFGVVGSDDPNTK